MKLRPRYPLQFLVSLLAAFLLWYGLAARRSEEIRGVRAQLTLVNTPSDLVLISSVPDTVAVQLRGSLSRALQPGVPLEVFLDLSGARPGTNSFPINGSDIPLLPSTVEVVSVEPSSLTLELERQLTRTLQVRPVIEGDPASGFVLGEIRVLPPQVTVQGPESRIADLEFMETAPVSVEGAIGPVEATVRPRVEDPLVRMLTAPPIRIVVNVVPQPTPTPTDSP